MGYERDGEFDWSVKKKPLLKHPPDSTQASTPILAKEGEDEASLGYSKE